MFSKKYYGKQYQVVPKVFCKKGVSKKFAKFTGRNPCWKASNFIKKRFLLNFVTFLRTPTLQNICKGLLLAYVPNKEDKQIWLTSRFLSALVPNGLNARAHQSMNGEELRKIISTLNTTFKDNCLVGFAPKTTKC